MEKKIRSATITQFDYIIRNINDEEIDVHGHLHSLTEYNEQGFPVRDIRYTNAGEFEQMYVYEYDEAGGVTRESYYPEEDQLAEETIFFRNDSGRIVRSEKSYQDGSTDSTEYLYDEGNHLIRKTTISDEGELEQVEIFEWEGDQIISHTVEDGSGESILVPGLRNEQLNETRITHNDKGQVIHEEEINAAGDVIMTVDRKYNEHDLAQEVTVMIDGQGVSPSRHYFLRYEYTFFG